MGSCASRSKFLSTQLTLLDGSDFFTGISSLRSWANIGFDLKEVRELDNGKLSNISVFSNFLARTWIYETSEDFGFSKEGGPSN